jgi:hypothetical protein
MSAHERRSTPSMAAQQLLALVLQLLLLQQQMGLLH